MSCHWESVSRSESLRRFSLRSRPAQSSILRGWRGSVRAGHGRLSSGRHRIYIQSRLCAENPRICFANTHRLRPAAAALARGLQTLRVCLTPAPCIEFDSPRYGLEIKRQVDMSIYLPVTYGGGAENRTPVHESPLIGISKLSRWFSLGRFARSDTLAVS